MISVSLAFNGISEASLEYMQEYTHTRTSHFTSWHSLALCLPPFNYSPSCWYVYFMTCLKGVGIFINIIFNKDPQVETVTAARLRYKVFLLPFLHFLHFLHFYTISSSNLALETNKVVYT